MSPGTMPRHIRSAACNAVQSSPPLASRGTILARSERVQAAGCRAPRPSGVPRPNTRLQHAWRSGQPRPDHVRQCVKDDPCFGTAHSFSLDRRNYRLAVLLSSERQAQGGQQHRDPNAFPHHVFRPHKVPDLALASCKWDVYSAGTTLLKTADRRRGDCCAFMVDARTSPKMTRATHSSHCCRSRTARCLSRRLHLPPAPRTPCVLRRRSPSDGA